jgi:hypothetical protein
MKRILIPILLLVSIITFGVPQKKKKIRKARQTETITKIEFESFARRGRTEVTITKDSVISIGRTEKKYILMTAEKWTVLMNALKKLKLDDIPNWQSPTKAREYDGAAHCKFLVSTKNKQYESQYFDSGKPMKQLQALYDAIENIRTVISEEGKVYQ